MILWARSCWWDSRERNWIGWVDILNSFENLRVVMVATRNALNLGAAARAMSNFGVGTLRVVNPYDPAFREAKSALRGRNVLAEAEVFTSVAEAVADCSLVVGTTAVGKRHLHHPLKRLEEGGKLIRKRLGGNSRGRLRTKNCVAILFGSEEARAFECGSEPLPLVDADSYRRQKRVDEFGAGCGGLFVRAGARCESYCGRGED